MADREPARATPIATDATTVLPWVEACQRLSDARFYWLATVHADGRPHVRPVLAVWMEGAPYSTSNPAARKAKNLDHDSRCAITVHVSDVDLVLEGDAAVVRNDSVLQGVAEAYRSKYGWPVTVSHTAFEAPYGAPTAGPPPYQVYRVRPAVVFAFGTEDTTAPRSTRWDFS